MADYRIVHNERTGKYRIERRRWWQWSFLTSDNGDEYLTFDTHQAASDHVCERVRREQQHRRWKVVGLCQRVCPNC